jgi:hypothetical protein|nr:MAG TPA: BppU domain protein [Caudoviricetes sp.]
MIKKTYKLTIDLKNGIMNYNVVSFITEDKGCNSLEITLLDSATQYNLTGNTTRFVAKTPSGAILQQNCTNKGGNVITIDLNQSFFTEQGIHTCEVQIYDTANQTLRVTFPSFKYNVTKSLMNDDNIQADSNFTILQDMINNVQNADRVSTEALETANEAKVIVDTLVPQANKAAQNAQIALDRAESVVTQEELAQKVTLGGNDTKFDFIENKVVSDNLSKQGIVLSNTDGWITNGSYPYTLIFKTVRLNSASWFLVGNGGWGLSYFDDYICITDVNGPTIQKLFPVKQGEQLSLAIQQTKDGLVEAYSPKHGRVVVENSKLVNLGGGTLRGTGHGYDVDFLIYNRILIQQELQQNFLALDNPPAIKELHTTNAEGETSILKLASSEDHVEMSTGRTLREEYMGVLKTLGKEFTSADGSSIEVNNGIEARVISGEIKGQTVKSIANVDDTFRTVIGDGTVKVAFAKTDIGLVKPSSDYTLVTEVISNTLDGDFKLININTLNMMIQTNDSIPAGKTGIFVVKLRSKADLTGANQIIRHALTAESTSGSITFRSCVFEGDLTKVVKGFAPFGLVSTEAIISNNGEEYPIYANEEDKTNRKVISLGGVGDVKNTLEILEDGSVVYTQNAIKEKLSDNLTWATATTNGTITRFYSLDFAKGTKGVKTKKLGNTNIVCNMLPTDKNSTEFNVSVSGYDTDGRIYVKLENSVADTVDKLKEYLTNNDVYVIYQLETPIVTHIPKELVPTILTHKTNILEAGGAVKPSSFKVTVPVDKLAEIEARLQALESTTVDVVLNK